MSIRKFRSTALMAGAALLFGISSGYAATATVTASIKFLTDISVVVGTSPNFGYVKAANVGIYALSTAGVVTPSGGGVIEGGTPAAGDLTITASTHNIVNIWADTYSTTGATTLSAATCNYQAAGQVNCDGVAHEIVTTPLTASSDLKLGLTATTTNAGIDGQTDSPTVVVHVIYQ